MSCYASWPRPSPPPSGSACPGNYAHATPGTLQRRFPDTPGEIISDGDRGVTVKINRRACSPVLRHARLPDDTTVP